MTKRGLFIIAPVKVYTLLYLNVVTYIGVLGTI